MRLAIDRPGERERPRARAPALEAAAINVGAVRLLSSHRAAEIAGRFYRVERVPYLAGLELDNMQAALAGSAALAHEASQVAGSDPARAHALIGEAKGLRADAIRTAVKVLGPLLRPIGRWTFFRRLRWRLGILRNPLHDRTEREIAGIVGFFSRIRTDQNGTFRSLGPNDEAVRTRSTRSRNSRGRSRVGSSPKGRSGDTRSPGRTTAPA